MPTHSPRLPAWKPPMWGFGQIAVQIYRDIPSLLLLFYMTQLLRIPPALAGLSIFGPKLLWSSVCDYFVGSWSDRYRDRLPRRALLLVGALLLPITLIGLFLPTTEIHPWGKAMHVSLWLLGYVTVFSLFSVPHLSIGAELAADPVDQSRVMAWRTAFIGFGVIGGAAFAPWLIQHFGGGVRGYREMSYIMAAVCSSALFIAFFASRETGTQLQASVAQGKWRALGSNRPFLFALGAFAAQMTGQGAAYASLSYLVVFRHAFATPFAVLSVMVIINATSAILIQPLAATATNRFGARRTFMVGSVFYSASLAWMGLGPRGSLISFYSSAVALGATNAFTLQSVYTYLSELITSDARRHGGHSNAGFYSSLFVAGDKIAFALGGTLLAGVMLSAFGFTPGATTQSSVAITGIACTFSIVPLIFNGIAICMMYRSRTKAGAAGTLALAA